jgi:hypothetical protein
LASRTLHEIITKKFIRSSSFFTLRLQQVS